MSVTATATYCLPSVSLQDDSIGSSVWAFPDDIKVNSGLTPPDGCAQSIVSMNTIQLVRASLVIDGVIDTAHNKATNQGVAANPNLVLGGTSDLWSATLTPTKVKATNFGVAISYGDNAAVGTPISYYLLANSFPFAIPDTSTILGVQAKLDHSIYAIGGGGFVGVAVDDVQMQITFSYDPSCTTTGVSRGQCYVSDTGQPERQKVVRYLVSDSDGDFVGEWKDVISDFSLMQELNNPLTAVDVKLARNETSFTTLTDVLNIEAGTNLQTESGLGLLVELAAATGLGPGTDLELNHQVDIVAYWGGYEELLTEDGFPIYTEDFRYIFMAEGAPEGRTQFSGYVTDWDLDFGSEDTVTVPLLNHSNELDNMMLQVVDTVAIDNSNLSTSYIGIASDGIGGNQSLAQTFTMVGNKNISTLSLFIRNGYIEIPVRCTISIYTGSNPNSLGTLLTQTSVLVTEYLDFNQIDFVFPTPIALTNASTYTIIIESGRSKSFSTAIYPLNFLYSSATYSGGIAYLQPNGELYDDIPSDLAFKLWEDSENTKVPFLSKDPSNIARTIIDFARSRGAHINYDADSIADTGTTVSYTFNLNTVQEALAKVLQLCPGDWYATYHPGSHLYSLQPRSETPQRFFTKKKDMVFGRLRRSIARIINRVYFTGGGDPALLVKVDDADSQNEWRVGIDKLTDQRVTDSTTATIMAQAHIDRYKNPEYIATMTISDEHYEDIEDISLGELVGFINFGDYIDDIELQIVGLNYKVDTVDLNLGTKLPAVAKRIEDIRRNLDTVEQQNNPDAPE